MLVGSRAELSPVGIQEIFMERAANKHEELIMAESQDRISANTRYQAVWNQTTAVVTERYRIFFQYTAVVLTLLALAVSRDEAKKLALVIPHLSFVAVLVLIHLEIIIELLTENQRSIVERHGLQDNRPRTEEWNFDRLGAIRTIWFGVFLQTLPIVFVVIGSSLAAFHITRSVVIHSTFLYIIWLEMPWVTGIAAAFLIVTRWWRVAMLRGAQRRVQQMSTQTKVKYDILPCGEQGIFY